MADSDRSKRIRTRVAAGIATRTERAAYNRAQDSRGRVNEEQAENELRPRQPSQPSRLPTVRPSGSVWLVLVLGGAMLFLALVKSGKVAEGQLIGVLAFLVAGTLYPPFGLLLGGLIVFGMFFRGGGTALFSWLGGLVNRQAGPAVDSQPLTPVAQTVQIPAGYNPFPAAVTNVYNGSSGVV